MVQIKLNYVGGSATIKDVFTSYMVQIKLIPELEVDENAYPLHPIWFR